ncbi:MAG: M20/M25/M40 family metallo-hydrolase [Gemmatimonadaceae bacterium]|nr:M20/M25/M40 family metallo-hydrolase [Gemmatimonadaceae bacterium]
MSSTRPRPLAAVITVVLRAASAASAAAVTATAAHAQSAPQAAPPAMTAHDSLARDLLRELIAINSTASGAQMSRATQGMAARLRAAGFAEGDVQLAGPDATHLNLVATLRGRDPSAKPVLLMAHVDVVEALRTDWTMDPFTLNERDGYYYGRGTTDNKGGAAIIIANMIRWKREGFVPSRDVIAILTTDEETSQEAGIHWLLTNIPRLKDAEYALNTDAGGLKEGDGKNRPRFFIQSSEKLYQTYTLDVTNRGGHSSIPRPDNAIYTLARALARLETYRFPVMYNEVTRASFARSATVESGQMAADLRALAGGATRGPAVERAFRDPALNGNLRTTCVATMLSGGHAENALPQKATATVNCRIFPGVSAQQVQATLQRVVADTAVHVTLALGSVPSPASPLRPDVMGVVERTAAEMWPRAVTIPIMENGATDGLYLRNLNVPVYGVSGPLYVQGDDRAHGRDERVGIQNFNASRELWYRMVKGLLGDATRM